MATMVNIYYSCLKRILILLITFRNMLKLLYKYSYLIDMSLHYLLLLTIYKHFHSFYLIEGIRYYIMSYTKDSIYIFTLHFIYKSINYYYRYKNFQIWKLVNRQGDLNNLKTYKIENEITIFKQFIDGNIN